VVELLGRERLNLVGREFLRPRRFDAFPETESSAALRHRAMTVISGLVEKHRTGHVLYRAHASVTDERWAMYSANETAHLIVREDTLVTF
jgi:hypothetical protein